MEGCFCVRKRSGQGLAGKSHLTQFIPILLLYPLETGSREMQRWEQIGYVMKAILKQRDSWNRK